MSQYSRTEMIFGKDAIAKLFDASIAVFGVGGVGGFAVEALTRSGIGKIDLYDYDVITLSNLNRQLHTTMRNIGQYKVDAAKSRILEINPNCIVGTNKMVYSPETSGDIDLAQYDYVIDAIDTISGKVELAVKAFEKAVPIISAMGAGNKLETTMFEVADIFDTSVCPLARVMRHELRKRGVESLKVVYSKEPAAKMHSDFLNAQAGMESDESQESQESDDIGMILKKTGEETNPARSKKIPPGSTSFVPPIVGMIIAGEVIRDLIR